MSLHDTSSQNVKKRYSSSARITFKGLWRSCPGLIGLISLSPTLFLIIWLGLGFVGTGWSLSQPEPGRILITQHGFRATGAIIEFDPASYDNPGEISISTRYRGTATVIFENTTTFPVTLCGGQNGECSRQAGQPSELNAPGFRLAPGEIRAVTFVITGGTSDYRISVYTNETTFRYNTLTVHVSYY